MMPKQKSWMPKGDDTALANKQWHLVDAKGMRLGRMSSEIAKLLLGKHKPTYTPGADMGDYVVVVNAEEVIVTGKKSTQKLYRRHASAATQDDRQRRKDDDLGPVPALPAD